MKKYCPHCEKYMGDHYGDSAVVSCGGCAYDAIADVRERFQAVKAEREKKQEEFRNRFPSWVFDKIKK